MAATTHPKTQTSEEQTRKEQQSSKLNWTGPEKEEWSSSTCHHWATDDGQYRVSHIATKADSKKPQFAASHFEQPDSWAAVENDQKLGKDYARYYDSLRAALDAVEKYHCQQTERSEVESNKEAIIAQAESLGMAGALPDSEEATSNKVVLDGPAVMSMFKEMGMHYRPDMLKDEKRMLEKVKALPSFLEENEERPTTEEGKKTMEEVLEAVNSDKEITIGNTNVFGSGKPSGKGGKSKAVPKVNGGNSTAGSNNSGGEDSGTNRKGFDEFGCRINSMSGKMNSVLTDKPQTIAELAKTSGASEKRVKAHFPFLMARGEKIKEPEEGKFCRG